MKVLKILIAILSTIAMTPILIIVGCILGLYDIYNAWFAAWSVHDETK